MSPAATSVIRVGVGAPTTSTIPRAEAPPAVAQTVAHPAPRALTTPLGDTFTALVSVDRQVMSMSLIAPSRSLAISPLALRASEPDAPNRSGNTWGVTRNDGTRHRVIVDAVG